MNVVIIGYGTQGKKRSKILKKNNINYYIVDPIYKKADAKKIENLNFLYSHAFVCTPDSIKINIILFLIKKNVKILVEKPLYLDSQTKYQTINKLLSKHKKSFLYVAYNHRFEPNIIKLKKYLDFKKIGKIYLIEMYYGNGTSKLWSKSPWRKDEKKGVVLDLAPHLLDVYLFLFKYLPRKNNFFIKSKNENTNIDYAQFGFEQSKFIVKFTTSLIDWKNKFEINIIGSKGSLHVKSLCKWSESQLIYRRRIQPSGVPKEFVYKEKKGDPTWMLEHKHFFNKRNNKSNFLNDLMIKQYIDRLFNEN